MSAGRVTRQATSTAHPRYSTEIVNATQRIRLSSRRILPQSSTQAGRAAGADSALAGAAGCTMRHGWTPGWKYLSVYPRTSVSNTLNNMPPKMLRTVLAALLLLLAGALPSLAFGDLFDNDYTDCPAAMRMRDGQIANLALARDAADAGIARASWNATHPDGWGLGANAFTTSLVLLVDDGAGEPRARTLGLTAKGAEVAGLSPLRPWHAQLAIVTESGGVRHLISDIIEARTGGRMAAPAFHSPWMRVASRGANPATSDFNYGANHPDASAGAVRLDANSVHGLWYVGYGEAFRNYRAGPGMDFATRPPADTLRIGLRHAESADAAAREAVDFRAYVLRITDADGDAVAEHARMRASDYGTLRVCTRAGGCPDAAQAAWGPAVPQFFFYDVPGGSQSEMTPTPPAARHGAFPAGRSSVRLVAGADAHPPLSVNDRHFVAGGGGGTPHAQGDGLEARPDAISNWAPGWRSDSHYFGVRDAVAMEIIRNRDNAAPDYGHGKVAAGAVFAHLPDYHRDFPVGTLGSDRTYTLEAWAVDGLSEAISPVARIRVRLLDAAVPVEGRDGRINDFTPAPDNLPGERFADYLNPTVKPILDPAIENKDGVGALAGTACGVDTDGSLNTPTACTLIVTEFTVILPADG